MTVKINPLLMVMVNRVMIWSHLFLLSSVLVNTSVVTSKVRSNKGRDLAPVLYPDMGKPSI